MTPKIIIRTPNWLGDLMMSTAFIKAVMDREPDAQVDLIVKSGFENIPLPHRGRILPYDKDQQGPGSFGWNLRNESYQQFFILPPSFSSVWMSFCSGAKQRIAYNGGGRGLLLNASKDYSHPPQSQHLVQEYLELLDNHSNLETHLPGLDIDSEWIEEHLKGLGLEAASLESAICIAPGAIYGPAKEWPIEHFEQLCHLLSQQGLPVVIVGTDADSHKAERMQQAYPALQNLCGRTSLNQLIAVLSASQLLISNDSGAMHIMAALQKPQIAIFGSTSLTWTSPLNPQAQCISLNLNCAPCFQRTCPLQHYNCLKKIYPEHIMAKVLKLTA